MRVAVAFAEIGLSPRGPVPWNTPIKENNKGIYVVALVKDKTASCAFEVEPQNPREQERWLAHEPIIYIGQTTKQTIKKRVGQFYRHKYGAKSPHRGGQAIKLLLEPHTESPFELWVYWVPTDNPLLCEHQMLAKFEKLTGHQPYANRKRTRLLLNRSGET